MLRENINKDKKAILNVLLCLLPAIFRCLKAITGFGITIYSDQDYEGKLLSPCIIFSSW